MSKTLKKVVLLTSFLVLGTLISGCSNKKKESSVPRDDTPYGKYSKTVTFTVGRPKFTTPLPKGMTLEDNPKTRYVKKMVNVKGETAWEAQNIAQKIGLSISTGNIPDVMVVDRAQYKTLIQNDLIQDLTDVYESTTSKFVKSILNTYGEDLFKEVKVDGKMMGFPDAMYKSEQDVMWIRKDWLDKTGKAVPKTLEEVFDLAQTFIKQDFAGGGKTLGLVSSNNVVMPGGGGGDTLAPVFSSQKSYPKSWIPKDGKTVYGSIQPETKKTLGKLAEQYKKGVLSKQFTVSTTEDTNGLISSGRAGIVFFPWYATFSVLKDSVKNDPNADWIAVPGIEDSEGNVTYAQNDPLRAIAVVRKDYNHPEAVVKAINLVTDYGFLRTKDAKAFAQSQFPNTPANELDPKIGADPVPVNVARNTTIADFYHDLTKAIETKSDEGLNPRVSVTYKNYLKYEKDPKKDLTVWGDVKGRLDGQKAAVSDEVKVQKVNFFDTTDTMKTKWANLQKLEEEMYVKIITGEEPVSYFDKFVTEWKKLGGADITKEVNVEVEKKN